MLEVAICYRMKCTPLLMRRIYLACATTRTGETTNAINQNEPTISFTGGGAARATVYAFVVSVQHKNDCILHKLVCMP